MTQFFEHYHEIYNCYATKLSSQMMIAEPKIHKAPLSLLAPSVKLLSHMVNMPSQLQDYAQGADLSHSQWVMQHEYALSVKQQCLKVFDQYDIILCPPIFTLAFEHNHQEPMVMRKLLVDGKKRFYLDLFKWITPATMMGIPATSAPIGLSDDNLPINIQILAQPYADKVTIKFAELLAKLMGGFQAPPLNFSEIS